MKELFDEILKIMGKYRMDAVYKIQDSYYTRKEVEQLQLRTLTEYLSGMDAWETVALYGGGGYCESIWEAVENSGKKIVCVIDNFKAGKVMSGGIQAVSLERFLSEYAKETDAVMISSWNDQKELEEELTEKGPGVFLISPHGLWSISRN